MRHEMLSVVELDLHEVTIEMYRTVGCDGPTETAALVTHLPTGIVTMSENAVNLDRALAALREQLDRR